MLCYVMLCYEIVGNMSPSAGQYSWH